MDDSECSRREYECRFVDLGKVLVFSESRVANFELDSNRFDLIQRLQRIYVLRTVLWIGSIKLDLLPSHVLQLLDYS